MLRADENPIGRLRQRSICAAERRYSPTNAGRLKRPRFPAYLLPKLPTSQTTLFYIFFGAVTPIKPSTRASTMRAASLKRSRALLNSRSAGSLETTRQSR